MTLELGPPTFHTQSACFVNLQSAIVENLSLFSRGGLAADRCGNCCVGTAEAGSLLGRSHCALPRHPDDTVRLGIRNAVFQRLQEKVLATTIAQYYMLVRPELCQARQLFRGLQRDLMFGDDMNADQNILIYCWRPQRDYVWVGDQHSTTMPRPMTPPSNRVFVVLARPHTEPDENGVYGELLKWNWVDGDPTDGPTGRGGRYKEPLWSR